MAKVNAPLYALNGGEVGGEAVSRLDLERLRFAGSLVSNVLPRVVGSLTIRPGLEHIMSIDYGDTRFLEYAFSGTTTFLPIISDEEMRIVKDDALVTRASVSTSITNGDFSSFTGWTDNSDGTATASVSGGQLVLAGTAFDRASATQTISVAGGDQNIEHGLRIKVARGPVVVRLGSSSGEDDLIASATLDDGDHSIAFTPTGGSIYLELYSDQNRQILLDSCQIDSAGTLVLTAPWADTDLVSIRQKQSIDTIYVASNTYQQREIQRRGDTSWGIQRYKTDNGPFKTYTGPISLAPSVLTGNGTLTASEPFFRSSMIGRLFRLFHSGQTVDADFTGDDQEGAAVRISGVGTARRITRTVAGTWSGTIYFQTATDDGSGNPTGWVDSSPITSNFGPTTISIPDDNVIKYVRFVIKAGDYVSGTIETNITYAGGSETGIARVTGVTNSTTASIEVLDSFAQTSATSEWDHSMWSDYDGWPRAVEIFGGRLFWTYRDTVWGSVSDEYKSFDDEIEGDSAPIIRSLGSGGQAGALWLLGLQRLLAGTDVSEVSVRSSAYDEPLTAANWFPLDASTQGSSDVRAVKVDTAGVFVHGDGTSIYQLVWDPNAQDYSSNDLTELHQEICDGSPVVALAVQRKPDTVVWFVLENGEARALTYEPSESVIAWSRVTTDGLIKDVASVKGRVQDTMYFAVVRNGTRRLEKLARQGECRGGSVNCVMDAFKRFTVTTSQTVFDMSHLPNGTDVLVWADGAAIHDQNDMATISGGNVTLASGVENCTVTIGLPYNGDWQSTKLAYGAQLGTALLQPKRVSQLGLVFYKTMMDGVRVGRDFDNLRQFTTTKNGGPLTPGELQEQFDVNLTPFEGDWDTDSRICVRMQAPYPCTIAALVMQVKTNDEG